MDERELRERRDLNRGFGDGMSKAFELAVTPPIFGLGGWWLDGRLGTRPVFTIVIGTLAVVGQFLSLWYTYDAKMRTLEKAVAPGVKADAATPEAATAPLTPAPAPWEGGFALDEARSLVAQARAGAPSEAR